MKNYDVYYELLEIQAGADEAAIKKSYKKLALKFHPDKNPGDEEATQKFLEIGEAYEKLTKMLRGEESDDELVEEFDEKEAELEMLIRELARERKRAKRRKEQEQWEEEFKMEQQRKKLARQREEREEEFHLKEQQLQRERQDRARRDDALRKKTASMLSGLRRTQTSYHIPTAGGSGGASSGFTSYSSYSSYNTDHGSTGSGYSYSANLASKWSNVAGTVEGEQDDQPPTTEETKQPIWSQEEEDPATSKPKSRKDSATPSEDSIPIRTRSPSPVQQRPSYTSSSAFHTPRHSFNDLHTPNRTDFSSFSSHLSSHSNRTYPSHSPDLLSPNYSYGGTSSGIGSGFSRSHDDLSHQGASSRSESPEFNRRFEQEQRERKIARNNDRIKNIKVELERLGEERIRLELENQQLRDKSEIGTSSSSRYQRGYYDNYNSLPRSFTANTRRYTTAGTEFSQYRSPESRDEDSA